MIWRNISRWFLRYSYFKNFTLKIQSQGHGLKIKDQSHTEEASSYWRFISLSFQIKWTTPSWNTAVLKFELEYIQKFNIKVMDEVKVQGSIVGPTSYWVLTHIHFILCQSALPFLRYGYVIILPWKSKVKVMGEVKVQGHINIQHPIHSHSLCSMSMGPPIPEIWRFQNPTLKIRDQGHRWDQISGHIVGPTSYWLTSFFSIPNDPPNPEIWSFQNLTLKI